MRIESKRAAHYQRCLRRAQAAFVDCRGASAVAERASAIATIPSKIWRGVPVFAVTCEGPFGKGPHTQFIPQYVLWSLIDVGHFVCPYHR